MNIDISTTLELDDDDLEKRIIAAAAEHVFASYHVRHEKASTAIELAITARAEKIIEDLFNRGIQAVDSFGAAKGEPRSVAEMFVESMGSYLSVTVNERGEPTRDSFGTKMPRAEYLIRKVAIDKLVELATAEMKRLNEEAKKAVRAVVANTIAAQMQNMAGSKS